MFCRRCGDIVSGPRCKCGGTSVSPVVAWKESKDPWTKTYVSRDKSPTRPTQSAVDTSVPATVTGRTSTSPSKRFPRPLSSSSSSSSNSIGQRVTEHITASTSQLNRPPSPLKNSTVISPETGILPLLNSHSTGSLAKVYGSVLQTKESLASHHCGICGSIFPPDCVIYPDPNPSSTSGPARFLCRDCFMSNGGSRGQCPECSRAVLALKSEGPYIEAAGAFWHKACFSCDGCGKNIGDSPMVDLLGKPSCAECFDSCLNRDRTPKKNRSSTLNTSLHNIGGVRSPGGKSREGSPALEELEQRLGIVKGRQSSPALEELDQCVGIVKSRQSSPALEELCHRLSQAASPKSNHHDSPSHSPSPRRSIISPDSSPLLDRTKRLSRADLVTGIERRESSRKPPSFFTQRSRSNSPALDPTADQIEEMKRRFMKSSPSSQASPTLPSILSLPRLRSSRSSGSLSTLPSLSDCSFEARTPDLLSDYSDSTTQSSAGPDSPPRQSDDTDDAFRVAKLYGRGLGTRYARSDYLEDINDVIIEETNSQLNTPDHTPKHKSVPSSKTTPVTTPSKTVTSGKSSSHLPKPNLPGSLAGQTASLSSSCAKCHKQLFSLGEGGQYVTVPDDTGSPKTYHTACFNCSVCGLEFKQSGQGQAAFVKGEKGPCHIDCAPPAKITVRKDPAPVTPPPARRTHAPSKSLSSPTSSSSSPNPGGYVSSRYSRPPMSAPLMSSSSSSMPRFGTVNACPGCKKTVPQVSFGISEGERSVQGPAGTRWHAMCLVCGGKKPTKGIIRGRDERKKGEPGCGKKLDSAAKTDEENGVYCRECWLLLPSRGSPTRSPILPSYTGTSTKTVTPQFTGTTTLARQFTGLSGGNDGSAPLLRQLTGGGLSPTRSLSPTKQLRSLRPRPKSVIGMRSSKSVDEGRGMFLVRQMTGNKS